MSECKTWFCLLYWPSFVIVIGINYYHCLLNPHRAPNLLWITSNILGFVGSVPLCILILYLEALCIIFLLREEVRDLAGWCQNNNLSLNVTKTKEMTVDYRKRRTKPDPILIDGAVVEQVESFKFLGVHITNKPTWSKHNKTYSPSGDWNDLAWVLRSSKGSTAARHHRENPEWLHHCLVSQQPGLRPQSTTEGSAYGPVPSEEGPKNCRPP